MKMKMKIKYLLWITGFYLSQSQAFAFVLPQHPLKAYDCDCANLSQETLQDQWNINNKFLPQEASNLRKSYSYKKEVTLKELQQGVVVRTLAPSAVIRITPLQKKPMPQLQLKTPKHGLLNLKDASFLYSEDHTLAESLHYSAEKQTILQIKPELGFGNFAIKTAEITGQDNDKFVINVLDKYATNFLEILSNATHYQYGDTFKATITFKDADEHYPIDMISASLIGPKGQLEPLKVIRTKYNQFTANTVLSSELNDHGENWYIEAKMQTEYNSQLLMRDIRTAFSYSIPSASLINIVKIGSKPLRFAATIDVSTASRYALQSVLFQNRGDEENPLMTVQKGQWLEPGRHVIQFAFDNSNHLSEDTLSLGYFRVLDYGQLKTVYQYDKAIKLTKLVD